MIKIKTYLFLGLILLGNFDLFGQTLEKNTRQNFKKITPTAIYLSPILDGGALAIEYSFNKNYSLNLYGLKRQADESIYYNTKVNESLMELFFKVYFKRYSPQKFNPFFGPAIGAKTIIYDETFGGRFTKEGFTGSVETNLNAKAIYFNPSYLGFDFVGKNGLIFEYAAGVCFQQSWGETQIFGIIYPPYTSGLNLRSRMLFGYRF